MTFYKLAMLLTLLYIPHPLMPYDDIHRFRPIYFFEEPHIRCDGLSNIYLSCAHGKADSAFSCDHNKVPLGDIFGINNLHDAAKGVASSILNHPGGQILQNIITPSIDHCFAHLSFPGTFEMTELVLKGFQNFVYGTFLTWYIPWRSLSLTINRPTDLTAPFAITSSWQQLLNKRESIFNTFQLSTDPYTRYGLGDVACSLGYAYSHDATTLDFIDMSVQLGIVFPTSCTFRPCHFFDIPLGYEGSLGYFGIFDASVGWYDWCTAGAHLQCLGFTPTQGIQKIKTDSDQRGLFILQQDTMKIWQGGAYSGGVYLKADHVLLGLSFTLGYSIVVKTANHWASITTHQPYHIPDQRLGSWSMQTMHIVLDYDCATHSNPNAPRVGFIYNTAFRGSRSLATAVIGALWDMTIIWSF